MKIRCLFILFFPVLLYSQWLPDLRLTNDEGISHTSLNNARCISSNLNYIHVVWSEVRSGGSGIYYKRSTDGTNWTPEFRLTTNSVSAYSPCITSNSEYIHIAWDDFRDGHF